MKPYPTHRQRIALQVLMPGVWMPLPKLISIGDKLLATLLERGWIERSPNENAGSLYRVTEAGRTAFRTPVPIMYRTPKAGLRRYIEWSSRGQRTGRALYVSKEWDLPKALPGAEWQLDKTFNLADELLRHPELKSLLEEALQKGSAIVSMP